MHVWAFCAGQDAFLLEPLFRADAWGFMCAPVSEANERAVYLSMAEGCRGALQVGRMLDSSRPHICPRPGAIIVRGLATTLAGQQRPSH
jgi:hypothetical protein